MSAIQKKICILGAFAVGKTSLVSRFVHSMFSEKYMTTLGLKVEKKSVQIDDRDLTLVLWDLAGEDDVATVRASYLRGMHGALLVADGTRGRTLEVALDLRTRVIAERGPAIPLVLVINKADLQDEWEVPLQRLDALEASGIVVFHGSAKSGEGVNEAFAAIARQLLETDAK